ncbi:MAG: hypothetical protein AAF570_29610, partial [Bacteroidota bacterium]
IADYTNFSDIAPFVNSFYLNDLVMELEGNLRMFEIAFEKTKLAHAAGKQFEGQDMEMLEWANALRFSSSCIRREIQTIQSQL